MEILIFLYNLVLIVLFSVCSIGFIILFLQKKEFLFFWLSILFAFFAIENSTLYMVDFIKNFSTFYDNQTLNFPFLKSFMSVVINLCYLKAASYLASKAILTVDYIAFAIYFLSLIIVPLPSTTNFTYWLYFTLSQIFLFYVIWRYIRNRAPLRGKELSFVVTTAFLNLLIVVEDAVVIFFYDDLYSVNARITQRNFCEDIQSIFFAIIAFIHILNVFRGYKSTIDETSEEYLENQHFEKRKIFIKKYELTDREVEILDLLLIDKTNLEISEELFIAVGTTKNHLHNIYRKSGATGRADILKIFQSVDDENNVLI